MSLGMLAVGSSSGSFKRRLLNVSSIWFPLRWMFIFGVMVGLASSVT